MMKNSQGFVLYSFIIFSPLLLILAFSLSWTFWFIIQKQKIDNLCHHYTLKSQEFLVSQNDRVLLLNSQAWMLIMQNNSLKAIVAPPPAKAAAVIAREIVIAEQEVLDKIQRGLILSANMKTKWDAFRFRQKFYKLTQSIQSFWHSKSYFNSKKSSIRIFWNTSKIEPQFRDTAPPYKRIDNQSNEQRLSAQWSIPIRSMLPPWFTHFVPVHSQWEGQCASHPHERRKQWIASTGKGKHSSKLSF